MKIITLVLVIALTQSLFLPAFSTGSIIDSIPTVGKPMPDFTLHDVDYFTKKQASLSDFKGKWLFLDFWFLGCTACVASMPKMDKLQKDFKDQLNIVFVGQNGDSLFRGHNIKPYYESVKKAKKLNLISAYDSTLAFKWEISAMPHIIIVNPEGIVYSLTNGTNLDSCKIVDLLNNKYIEFESPKAAKKLFEGGPYIDSARIANPNLMYRSYLAKCDSNDAHISHSLIDSRFNPKTPYYKEGNIFYKAEGEVLFALYNIAYFGKVNWSYGDSLYYRIFPFPVLEIKEKSLFYYNKFRYNYALTVPSVNQNRINFMQFMQEDLFRSFGYRVKKERRSVPVWVISGTGKRVQTLKPNKTFKSNTGEIKNPTYREYEFNSVPFRRFLSFISSALPMKPLPWEGNIMWTKPLINESEVNDSSIIKLTLKGSIAKVESLNEIIRNFDLEIVEDYREYEVLVISDF